MLEGGLEPPVFEEPHMAEKLQRLRRALRADPEDIASHLALLRGLERLARPLLSDALKALAAGAPIGEQGLSPRWFAELWRPVSFRPDRTITPHLKAGPLAPLSGADLYKSELRQRDLRGSSFERANLVSADLCRADLGGANLRDALLDGANLIRARLQRSDLRRASLTCADFIGANLRGARLRGANLDFANLRSAELSGADLRGASLVGCHIEGWPRSDVLTDDMTLWPDGRPQGERRRTRAALPASPIVAQGNSWPRS